MCLRTLSGFLLNRRPFLSPRNVIPFLRNAQADMNYEGTPGKAQQSSFSSVEETSPWSAQKRTAVARMEQYVNKSEVIKFEIADVEDYSLGPEYSDVDVKKSLRHATREGRNIFEVFSVKGEVEHLVASKWRWDDIQKQGRPQKEIGKKKKNPELGDKRRWLAEENAAVLGGQ